MEYTELEVWKESRILVNNLYEITKEFPKVELYGLTSQILKCKKLLNGFINYYKNL